MKCQSVPSQANFELTRGLNLQAWHLQQGSCVCVMYRYHTVSVPDSEDPSIGRLLPLVVSLAELEEVLPPLPPTEVHPHDVAPDDARVRVVVLEGERLGTLN